MKAKRKLFLNEFWMNLSTLGISSEMPIETSRKVILTNQLSCVAFLLVFSMNFSFLFIEAIEFKLESLLSSLLILINPLLNRMGYYRVSAFSFSILMSVATLFFSSLSKTVAPQPIPFIEYIFPKILLMGFLVLPLILIDSRNKVLLILALLINTICILLVDTIDKAFGVELNISQVSFENFERINFLILFPVAVIIIGFYFLNRINITYETTILKQNERLKSINNIVNKYNNDLTTSIEYAKYIQQAILPQTHILEKWFADSFVYYKAKSIVSGDFYFFKESKVNNEKCIVITAADCTGHGVPGGFMSVLGISLLNEIVQEGKFINASDILNQLRSRLKEAFNQTDDYDQSDGIEMALIVYYPETQKLEFSGAKNPLYIVTGNNEIVELKGDRMPIGFHLKEKPFKFEEIKLKGNEMCYLFTDGLVDQMNSNSQKYMKKNLQELILKINSNSCKEQNNLLTDTMASWMQAFGDNTVEQIDDMLMLGFRIPK